MSHKPLSAVLQSLAQDHPTGPLDSRNRELLRSYMTTLAHVGPTTTPDIFPDKEHILAYLINAHMAWSVALSQVAKMSNTPVDDLANVGFPLDGGTTNLAELAYRIVKLTRAEPRVGLFLNRGYRGGPPLPPAALEGHSLVWQFADHARRCGWAQSFWVFEKFERKITIPSFADNLPDLPLQESQKYRLILDLVPPPEAIRISILAECGDTLQKCRVVFTPQDRSRQWAAPRFDT